MRRFYRDLDVQKGYNRYSTLFYDGLKETNQAYADVKKLQELGHMDEAAKVVKDKNNILQLRRLANRAQRNLTQVNKQIDQVKRNSSLDATEKRRQIDRLNAQKAQITKMIGSRFEGVKAVSAENEMRIE